MQAPPLDVTWPGEPNQGNFHLRLSVCLVVRLPGWPDGGKQSTAKQTTGEMIELVNFYLFYDDHLASFTLFTCSSRSPARKRQQNSRKVNRLSVFRLRLSSSSSSSSSSTMRTNKASLLLPEQQQQPPGSQINKRAASDRPT